MCINDRPCPLLHFGFSCLHAEATVIMHQCVHAVVSSQRCSPGGCGTTCMSRVVTPQAQPASIAAHILLQAAVEQS